MISGAPSSRGRLHIRNIEKRFSGNLALGGVSLSIEPGEFVALLGPSGCGKTTLLRCICGLARADAGDIELDGRSLLAVPPWKRDVSVVFQSYALFPHMSVSQNVAFGLRMRRIGPKEIARRVDAALEMVRLGGLAARLPSQLSGGQQQRVALARALVVEPTLLLLDEPLAALDARLRSSVQLEIRQLRSRLGITTVLVTHDQAEAMVMADRIAVMNQGLIEQFDSARALYRRPATPFVADFIGEMNRVEGTVADEPPARLFVAEPELRIPLQASTPARRGAATLMVRPEAISVRPAADGADKSPREISGVITHAIHIGDRILLFVACAGIALRAIILNASDKVSDQLKPGLDVFLSWDLDDVIIFNH